MAWADLRGSWWLPASVPTVAGAWARRIPDRDLVPAGHGGLWRAWLVYNHVALLVPVLAAVVVGVLTPLVWVVMHPARLLLALVIAVPFIAAVAALI